MVSGWHWGGHAPLQSHFLGHYTILNVTESQFPAFSLVSCCNGDVLLAGHLRRQSVICCHNSMSTMCLRYTQSKHLFLNMWNPSVWPPFPVCCVSIDDNSLLRSRAVGAWNTASCIFKIKVLISKSLHPTIKTFIENLHQDEHLKKVVVDTFIMPVSVYHLMLWVGPVWAPVPWW